MNIVVIFSDQQHKYALGRVNPDYITPNLDRLSEEGVMFTNAYSNNPVCGPYRGCLLSGQYTSHCGVWDNGDPLPQNQEMLPEAAKRAGYVTSYVGKWHLGATGNVPVEPELRPGFDYFMGYQCYNGFNPEPPYNNQVVFFDENQVSYHFHKHRTEVTTDLAIQSLDRIARQEAPFLLMVSYQAPHYPEQPLEEYARKYQDAVFTLPPDYKDIDPYTETFSPPSIKPVEKCPDYQNYGNDMQTYLRLYAALCSQVDDGVGAIIDKLKALNKYEDTLIIYTADHGDMQGSRGLKNKCYPYERSCGVPFIIRCPEGRQGEISEELVSGVDVFPTVLSAMHTEAKEDLDGTDLLPYRQKKSDQTQPYIIAEHYSKIAEWRMLRNKNYKLISDMDYQIKEIYNISEDPYELRNLIEEETLSEKAAAMVKILREKTGQAKEQILGIHADS